MSLIRRVPLSRFSGKMLNNRRGAARREASPASPLAPSLGSISAFMLGSSIGGRRRRAGILGMRRIGRTHERVGLGGRCRVYRLIGQCLDRNDLPQRGLLKGEKLVVQSLDPLGPLNMPPLRPE